MGISHIKMNRAVRTMLAIPVFCVALSACQRPVGGYGNLQGHVGMSQTGLPMEGVSVVYGDSAVYSDPSGEYLYENLPAGLQGVWFRMDGYYTVLSQVNIPEGGTAVCDVEMEIITSGWAVGAGDSGYGTILYTTNAGMTWVRQGNMSTVPDVKLTGVCAVSDQVCWAVGEADTLNARTVILYTEDAGTTWTNQGSSVSGLPPVSLSAVMAVDSDTAYAVASDTCLVLKTTNSGSSWKVCRESPSVISYSGLSVSGGNVIWCCGTGVSGGTVVEYSTDGGIEWNSVNVDAAYALQKPSDICLSPDGTVYLAGTDAMGVLASYDGGMTWKSLLSGSTDISSLELCGAETAWASGSDGILYITSDGFATSHQVHPASGTYASGKLTSVSFLRDASMGVVSVLSATGATGTMFYTTDGGNAWTQSSLPFEFSIEAVDFVGGNN